MLSLVAAMNADSVSIFAYRRDLQRLSSEPILVSFQLMVAGDFCHDINLRAPTET